MSDLTEDLSSTLIYNVASFPQAANVVAFLEASVLCISRQAFEAALGGPLQSIMDAESKWKDALALQREVLARKNTATGRLVQVSGSIEAGSLSLLCYRR